MIDLSDLIIGPCSALLTWGARAVSTPEILGDVAIEASTATYDENGEVATVIDNAMSASVEQFLAEPAVISLMQLHFVAALAPEKERAAFGDVANAETFSSLTATWCRQRGETWHHLAGDLWEVVTRSQGVLVERLNSNGVLSEAARNHLVDRFLFKRLSSDPELPTYLRLIEGVCRDESRQIAMREFLHDASQARPGLTDDSFTVQGLDEDTATFEDLFVHRTVLDTNTGTRRNTAECLDASTSPRAVIIGDPGAGKSTLLAWLKWRAVEKHRNNSPVVVEIACRDALAKKSDTVLGALRQRLSIDLAVPVSESLLMDLLAFGMVMPVVDGVDEILDKSQRSSVVRQLASLAYRHPITPILCTTRKTGFEVELFRQTPLVVYHLEEYTDGQVNEYADKWFAPRGGPERTARFLGESRALAELRRNPLMLALLCTLYVQSDYIPQSRREIYLRCATLMWREWDTRRGIDVPNLFKARGEAVVRDVAYALHMAGGVSASIERRQLTTIVKNMLMDKGEEEISALTAADGLLEYCSGRAWILSKVTHTQTGQDAFAFTHRTFFEFFTAEALVRRINRANSLPTSAPNQGVSRLGPVAREIVEAYRRDTSSVMPELLLQAADDLMDSVNASVLHDIRAEALRLGPTDRTALTTLSVRLVAAAGVKQEVADRTFADMLDDWRAQIHHVDLNQFRSLLDVASGHRQRLCAKLITTPADGIQYLRRYSRLALTGGTTHFSEEWNSTANAILAALTDADLASDPIMVAFAAKSGRFSTEDAIGRTRGKRLLELEVDGQSYPGLLWPLMWGDIGALPGGESATAWHLAREALLAERLQRDLDSSGLAEGLAYVAATPNQRRVTVPTDVLLNVLSLASDDVREQLSVALDGAVVFRFVAEALQAASTYENALEQSATPHRVTDSEKPRLAARRRISHQYRVRGLGDAVPPWLFKRLNLDKPRHQGSRPPRA